MKTDCCCQPSIHPDACGCCEGVEALTPLPTENRPGLPMLSYRIGTHSAFLETMKARLSSSHYPKLAELTTRAADDPAIAMLDAWATVADVLSFYQERIANEGYLRTATERRSVHELARLVGYRPRPGVSASVYLAYTLDENAKESVTIPKGAKSQSIPGPDELPQTFETSEALNARSGWNNLKPRTSKPQIIPFDKALYVEKIYLAGTSTSLKTNDPLLLVYGEQAGEKILRRVKTLNVDFGNDRTEALLQAVPELVYVWVDAMRSIVNGLDDLISNIDNMSFREALINVRELFRWMLNNFTLGNFPPLYKMYFNHERIYRYFGSLNPEYIHSVALERPALVYAYLWRIWRSFKEIIDGDDSGIVVGLFVDALIASVETYIKDIVCLFRYLLQQMQPKDAPELDTLLGAADELIPNLIDSFQYCKEHFPNELHKFVDAFENLLGSDKALYVELSSLISLLLSEFSKLDPSSFPEAAFDILQRLNGWLDTIIVVPVSLACGSAAPATTNFAKLISPSSALIKPPVAQVKNNLRLSRDIGKAFSADAGATPELVINFQPLLKSVLYQAWANATVETSAVKVYRAGVVAPDLISVHALRLSAALFGSNASKIMGFKENTDPGTKDEIKLISVPDGDWSPSDYEESATRLYLDNAYDNIVSGAHVVINDHQRGGKTTVATIDAVTVRPRTAYTNSGKTTQIELSRPWWSASDMESLRKTIVYLETEKLSLALTPDTTPVSGQDVELQDLYGGLAPGRWLIVSGELDDVSGSSGVRKAELAMLSAVEHIIDETLTGGDKTHTRITFDKSLASHFKRDSVVIYGNVVKASHGDTRKEVLGSGDGAKALQAFALKQPPLTFVPAANPIGVDSTLNIFVNDIKWQETATLAGLSGSDRNFITQTNDEGVTTVVFGNGREGARLPSGIENVKAQYRSGIGKAGNVKAEQISLLISRPLGVKEVINPLNASGGADRETRDQARKHAPLAVMALDRLVSVQDYEDFSRLYAGIGKAQALELSDGRRQLVYITVAGADDIPIDKSSDLYRNLHQALLDFGDPYQAIRLEIRELMLIVISAGIRILPDYQWEPVVTEIRSALLEAFSFERRELGQDVLLSEVISVIQRISGVAYVDVDAFGGIPELILDGIERRLLDPQEIAEEVLKSVNSLQTRLSVNTAGYKDKQGNIEKDASGNLLIHPAQIAFITPEVPETLILNQIT